MTIKEFPAQSCAGKPSPQRTSEQQSPFLRMPDVSKITTYTPQHLYKLIERGEFPKPIKLGLRRSAWLRTEIDQWILDKIGGLQ